MSKTMSRRVGVARPEAAVTGTGIPRSVVRKPRGFASPTVASEARAAVALSRPSLDDGKRSSRVAARASLSFDKQGSESTDLSSGGSRFNSDCVDVLVGATSGKVVQLYRTPLLSEEDLKTLLDRAQREVSADIDGLESEACFNLEVTDALSIAESETVLWLLGETYELDKLTSASALAEGSAASVVEVGPRMSFSTAWSSNAVSIFKSCGLGANIGRAERSSRFRISVGGRPGGLTDEEEAAFADLVHDRMTEQVYPSPLLSFKTDAVPAPVLSIPVLEEGRPALERISEEMGLAFDDWDIDYYCDLFTNQVGRNPTNVELFDLGQSNSEHSRHWFFKGELTVVSPSIESQSTPGLSSAKAWQCADRKTTPSLLSHTSNSLSILTQFLLNSLSILCVWCKIGRQKSERVSL